MAGIAKTEPGFPEAATILEIRENLSHLTIYVEMELNTEQLDTSQNYRKTYLVGEIVVATGALN